MQNAGIPLGRVKEWLKDNILPDELPLWSYHTGISWDSGYTFKKWTNRAAMLKCIEMQGKRSARPTDWKSLLGSRWF